MPPSAGLGLLALLRRIHSFGHTLKSVILRCLLFWPHLLRRIWPLCSGTDPRDLPSESGSTRALHLSVGPSVGQSQSAPRSPVSSIEIEPPSSPDSPHSDRPFPGGSTPSIANTDDIQLPYTIPRLDAPLTLMHSRITSAQFAGTRRSRSRSPSPLLRSRLDRFLRSTTRESDATSGHSRTPSPSPSRPPSLSFLRPHLPHRLPESIVPDSSGGIQIPDVVISPPSAPDTAGTTKADSSPPFPVPVIEGNVSQVSSAGEEHLMPGPSYPGISGLGQENARHSGDTLAPPSNQARLVFPSDTSLQHIPTVNESGDWSDGKRRSIGLMHSEQVSRYVNKGDVERKESYYTLHPMQVKLPKYSQAKRAKGWKPATHPGGAVYFYHAERNILTDRDRPRHFSINNYDLVLDVINLEKDEIVWAYYYVDHDSRTLFWQDTYDCGDSLLSEVSGVKEGSHVKLRLESLYWVHWSLFPTFPDRPHRVFPGEASKELLRALLSSGIDSLTSKVSTSPYSVAEIASMRDFIKEAKDLDETDPHVITSVARLLSFYAQWRFIHFHGQQTTRQDCYKSIYKDSCRRRTYLIRIFSPILFFFPDVHLRELGKLWTDEIIVEALWKNFMQKLVSEWTDFVLYSTVMLAANVAFLAIPGVVIPPPYPSPPSAGSSSPPANPWIKPSPAQITSSISLVFSIGSIITGLLLIRRNRNMMTKDARRAWYYLNGMNWIWCQVGLEPLAIVFSLTYALLMWSAWGFFVALLIFSFQNMSRTIWISVGTAAGIVAFLIVWCIINTWDSEEREDEPDLGRETFLNKLKSRNSKLKRDMKHNHAGIIA
ncbi:hypothetical protein V8E53_001376 [Lactarius tabidus]